MERAVAGLGEATVTIEGLSAGYLRFDPGPGRSEARPLRLVLADESDTPATGTAYVLPPGGKPGEERPFPSGKLDLQVGPGESLLVVVSGVLRGAPSHKVTVRLTEAPAQPGPQPMPPMEGSSGCALGGQPAAAGWGLLLLLLSLEYVRTAFVRRVRSRANARPLR
jgi:hypothetical protein